MTTAGAPRRDRRPRYDERMFSIMNNREADALYATVARRRVAVAVHVVLTVASVVTGVGVYVTGRTWLAIVLIALILPWCVATGVINGATRGLLELRTHVLDERQLAERDRVRARANRLTTYLLAGAVIGVAVCAWTGQVPTGNLLAPVLVAVFVAHWLMPMWVAGLAARDEPEEGLEAL
ncbi:hypothetical protein SSOG_05962 [Streptomyces himastatinicus ATCC 53653]|uniref:Uncharacterized protein n=1 Tax=Streptomyces himastatinicus ATCC 53653 TaxID=457427 RepID=D9WT27_9ACTN|nr:hypothetical protein [Streptomyces himastatinicus]EFL26248.1 hypothetical protein SSOG_05962 [Streptomyces himastatinicus ATCC 53653]